MTTSVTEIMPGNDRAQREADARARVEHAVSRARLNLIWERVWPLVAPFVILAAFYAAISWLGVWRITTAPVRYAILAAFAVAIVYLLWRVRLFAAPNRVDALARVEEATGTPHRPASSFSDRLATDTGDPATGALWIAHRQRLLAALDRLRAGIPTPRLAARDPYAVRFLVALLFVVGFVTAGPERIQRLGEALQGGESAAVTIARIDAWVTPPTYTGRAPMFLTGASAPAQGTDHSVPAGSIVTVRTGGTHDLEVLSVFGDTQTIVEPSEDATPTRATTTGDSAPLEHLVTLTQSGSVAVTRGGREVTSWQFVVEPDQPPTIALLGQPEATIAGAIELSYTMRDDYGVIAAYGDIVPQAIDTEASDVHPLFEAPELPLTLPQLRTRQGDGHTIRDLTSHPWAGATVDLTLVARDEYGQEGRSQPVTMELPSRQFINPLARAVVEQRTKLALDANAAVAVSEGLEALTLAPEKTYDNGSAFLGIRTAYQRLVGSRNDDDLRDVVDYLWAVAVGIEEGELSGAAQELRQAQEALREALENGASDEEIQQLTENLREAMNRFMQALLEEARRNQDMANLPPSTDTQSLSSRDLQDMLDQIENLAMTGARDAAQQLLDQLQAMLDNLQAAQPMMGDQQQQQGGEMMQALNELGQMIQRQEELMNQTFQAERGMDPTGQSSEPLTPEEMEQALNDLQGQQEALEQQLEQLMQQMGEMNMPSNGDLQSAQEQMGQAAGNLAQSNPGNAVGNQGNALEALRQGAQGMAQQLANAGQQQNSRGGGRGNNRNFSQEDPLGRPQRTVGTDLGTTVKVPDEIDVQRAREILDAIRERLGELNRPPVERDYLERLIKEF